MKTFSNYCFIVAILIAIMSTSTLFTSTPQVTAFGYIPRIIIAQIAALHNTTTQPLLQPILTNAFDGYFKPNQYNLPYAAGELSRALGGSIDVFQDLDFNPTPFNVANDTIVVKSIPVSQTNSPYLSAQAAVALQNHTSIAWGKAQNIIGLFHLIPALHNPLKNINFFSDEYTVGDKSGRNFKVNYETKFDKKKYIYLADVIDDILGYYSKSSDLLYSLQTTNKTTNSAIEKEAKMIMKMFPSASFSPSSITVPETYTRYLILGYFKNWARESFLLGNDIYNSFLNYPKTTIFSQEKKKKEEKAQNNNQNLLSDSTGDLMISSTYANQGDNYSLQQQLFPGGKNIHHIQYDENFEINDNFEKNQKKEEEILKIEDIFIDKEGKLFTRIHNIDNDDNDITAVPITPEQEQYFRYILMKQMAIAGYRLASLLRTVDPYLNEGALNVHPGSVSSLYRAVTLIAAGLSLFAIFYLITYYKKITKAMEKNESLNNQQSLLGDVNSTA